MCPGRSPSSPCPDLPSSGDGLLFMKNVLYLESLIALIPTGTNVSAPSHTASTGLFCYTVGFMGAETMWRPGDILPSTAPAQSMGSKYSPNPGKKAKKKKNGAPSKYPHSLTNAPGEK